METRDEQVDRLLHDAESAEAGADVARMLGDAWAVASLSKKALGLRFDANRLDPKHEAPAWAEDAAWRQRK